jgi:nucleoid-associated protein YgaU
MAVADLRTLAAALALLTLSGCAYVHFGRHPPSDPRLIQDNSDLRLEKTILQQELAIAHKEGDALRTALEAKAGGGTRATELAGKLDVASRELAELRTRYATMQNELARPPAVSAGTGSAASAAALQTRLTATEDQLATALRDFTKLQEDNARLRQDLDRTRGENAALAVQVRDLGTQNRETQTALTQLNAELLAQKESRARAEEATEALRTQLHTVIAQSRPSDPAPTLDGSRETAVSSAPAMETAGLSASRLSGAATPPTATLSANPKRSQPAAAPDAAGKMAAESAEVKAGQPATVPPRIHLVAVGETLEKIAAKYYGNPERWRLIYDANGTLLRDGHPLTPGMELVIPGGPNPAP